MEKIILLLVVFITQINFAQSVFPTDGGNVGIGTITPEAKLTVNGDIKINDTNAYFGSVFSTNDYSTMIFISRAWQSVQGNNGKAFSFQTHNDFGGLGLEMLAIYYGEKGKVVMAHNGGNVGIGTTSPDEKLTVKGKIHTQEVKVDLLGALVPDYVFAKDYKLKPLQEVEAFVKINKHLPEIPSANEIEKNGLMLAEMNISLLKKIEELTLYAIEQGKKISTQSVEIEALKKENENFQKLSQRLSSIEQELKTKK